MGAPSSFPALINVQHPAPVVSGPLPVDQRCRLPITVVGLISVPEAATDRRSRLLPPRGHQRQGAPPEKDPIVTQLVTQGRRDSIAHGL